MVFTSLEMFVALILSLTGSAAQDSTPVPPAPAQTEPSQAPQEESPTEAKAKPKRVHIVIDRFREIGGVVLSQDDASITIEREGRTETFERNKILAVVELLDIDPDGNLGVVYLRDGSVLDAMILEDAFDHVTVEIEGIRHQVPRDEVDHVEVRPEFEVWLKHVRSQIDPENLEARIELARWIAENNRLEEACLELRSILKIDDHPEAKQLMQMYEARIALEAEGTSSPKPLPPKVDRLEGLPQRQLTENDVNIIRVYEIDFNHPPKVTVGKKTIDKLIRDHGNNSLIPPDARGREQLFRMRDIDQVKLIFEVKARDLYPEIKVESVPHSLGLFRKHVHNAWLIRNCATSGCHGGPNAGRFFLHRINPSDPRTVLENLLILERLDLDGPYKLIDYENPEMSLLVQYALSPTDARIPHPTVPGYSSTFPSGESRMRTETIRWIRSMYQPRPKYPVDFTPMTQDAPLATEPARIPR